LFFALHIANGKVATDGCLSVTFLQFCDPQDPSECADLQVYSHSSISSALLFMRHDCKIF
jgi:hypothetical protein